MRTKSIPVYTYAELSDTAKDQVRFWWSQDIDYDCVYEDAATIADLLGIDIRQTRKTLLGGGHRYDPTIYWSGFWSQGDGACFEGTYKYKKGPLTRSSPMLRRTRNCIALPTPCRKRSAPSCTNSTPR